MAFFVEDVEEVDLAEVGETVPSAADRGAVAAEPFWTDADDGVCSSRRSTYAHGGGLLAIVAKPMTTATAGSEVEVQRRWMDGVNKVRRQG